MTNPTNITHAASELRECPFCGRAPDESSRPSTKSADEIDGEIFFLSCKCGGFSARAHQYGHSRAEVISKWNTRTLTASQERIAALEGALRTADEALCEYACHQGAEFPCRRSIDQCASSCGKPAGDALILVTAALAPIGKVMTNQEDGREVQKPCETCGGEGSIEHPHMPLHHSHSEAPEYAVVECDDCQGRGWSWEEIAGPSDGAIYADLSAKQGHTATCPRFEDTYPWECDCRAVGPAPTVADRQSFDVGWQYGFSDGMSEGTPGYQMRSMADMFEEFCAALLTPIGEVKP